MLNDALWLLAEAGTSFFEIILIQTFLNGFLEKRELSRSKKIIPVIIAFSLIFLLSTYFYDVSFIIMINFFIVTFLFSFILYEGKFLHRLFSCILLLALLVVAEFITVYIIVWSLDINPIIIKTNASLKFAGVVVKNIISFAIITVICSFRKSSVRESGRLYFAFLLIVPVISIFISIIIFELARAYDDAKSSAIMFAFLGLMYINAIVFAIFESITRFLDREYKYKMVEKQLELQINHYNKLAENRELLFETIHDFKNHLNCIYNLYKYNKGDELGSYLKNLMNLSNTESIIDTGNPVIDALLNDKSNIANKYGITFKKVLNLPSNVNIAHNDICAILGNSLDNAIEACKRIENKSLIKEIELSMNYRESYLIIVVTNTFDKLPAREGKFFRSSKLSPGLHGFGMQSIERTVKKYSGNMVVKYDKSLFTLEIVMSTA